MTTERRNFIVAASGVMAAAVVGAVVETPNVIAQRAEGLPQARLHLQRAGAAIARDTLGAEAQSS